MTGWLGFSLMALGLWGLWGFFSKLAAPHLPPQGVYAVAMVGNLVVLGISWAVAGLSVPWQPGALTAAVAAGLCSGCALLCFFQALSAGKAAVVVPLTALYPVVTVALSCLLLKECATPRQLVGIALAMVAVWLLSE